MCCEAGNILSEWRQSVIDDGAGIDASLTRTQALLEPERVGWSREGPTYSIPL
jgi:hypothetical protein